MIQKYLNYCQGSVMHVPQDAWTQQDTIFNNIVFGLPLIETKMDKIMKGCSLVEDLEKLPQGEQTMCGDHVRINFNRSILLDI